MEYFKRNVCILELSLHHLTYNEQDHKLFWMLNLMFEINKLYVCGIQLVILMIQL